MSLRYIVTGSAVLAPISKAGVGVVGPIRNVDIVEGAFKIGADQRGARAAP